MLSRRAAFTCPSLVHIHPELPLLHEATRGADMTPAFGIAPREACFERGTREGALPSPTPACPRPPRARHSTGRDRLAWTPGGLHARFQSRREEDRGWRLPRRGAWRSRPLSPGSGSERQGSLQTHLCAGSGRALSWYTSCVGLNYLIQTLAVAPTCSPLNAVGQPGCHGCCNA